MLSLWQISAVEGALSASVWLALEGPSKNRRANLGRAQSAPRLAGLGGRSNYKHLFGRAADLSTFGSVVLSTTPGKMIVFKDKISGEKVFCAAQEVPCIVHAGAARHQQRLYAQEVTFALQAMRCSPTVTPCVRSRMGSSMRLMERCGCSLLCHLERNDALKNCRQFFSLYFCRPTYRPSYAVTMNIMLMVSALLILPHAHSSLTLHLLQWTTVGDVDIDIGANPSAEEAEEGVESNERKTVDIIESFRLNVSPTALPVTNSGIFISLLFTSRATWKGSLS